MNCFLEGQSCRCDKRKNRSFADFAKIPPQKDRFPAVFRLCRNDQSKERINLPGVTLFDLWRISNRSGGKVGVPPRQLHSRSSVASSPLVGTFAKKAQASS